MPDSLSLWLQTLPIDALMRHCLKQQRRLASKSMSRPNETASTFGSIYGIDVLSMPASIPQENSRNGHGERKSADVRRTGFARGGGIEPSQIDQRVSHQFHAVVPRCWCSNRVWPNLGVKVEQADGQPIRVVYARERYRLSEAITFYEFALESLIAAKL
jgi:hypothetical protein